MVGKKAIATIALVICLALGFWFPVFAGGTGQITEIPDFTLTQDRSTSRALVNKTNTLCPAETKNISSGLSFNFRVMEFPDMSVGTNYVIKFCFSFSGVDNPNINFSDQSGTIIGKGWSFDLSLYGNGSVAQKDLASGMVLDNETKEVSFQISGLNVVSSDQLPYLNLKITPVVPLYAHFPPYTPTKVYEYQTLNYSVTGSFTNLSFEELVDADDLLTETKKQTEIMQEQTETSKGILASITDFFGSFFDNLKDFFLGLIVPSSEDLTNFLNEVNDWFGDRLGFIWYPFSLMIDLVTALALGEGSQYLTVPALSLNILGNTYSLWNEIQVDMDAFSIFTYVRYFTSALLVSCIVKMAMDKWDEWIGGHGA